MKNRRVICTALSALMFALAYDIHRGVFAQSTQVSPTKDVCASSVKLSIPLAAATSTTVPLISSSSATSPLNICGLTAGINTSSTFKLVAGTGTACGTSTELVTGALPAGTYHRETTVAVVPNGKDLCLTTTGTGGGGVITYAYGGLNEPTTTATATATPSPTPT